MAEHMPFAEVNLPGIHYPFKGNVYGNIDILNLSASISDISTCCRWSFGLVPLQRAPSGSPLWLIWQFLSLLLSLCHAKQSQEQKKHFTSTSRNREHPLCSHFQLAQIEWTNFDLCKYKGSLQGRFVPCFLTLLFIPTSFTLRVRRRLEQYSNVILDVISDPGSCT